MLPISVPPVPYGATAVRPDWADLPAALRDAITGRLGAPVTAAASAGGGFTRGFAAVLATAHGDRVFVKAASRADQPHVAEGYAREAMVAAVLPAVVPAPRLRWTMSAAGHIVTCFEAIDGRMPRLPWAPDDLDAALAAWATAAAALREPPPHSSAWDFPALADLLRADLSWWGEVAAGRHPLPAVPAHAAARLPELAALEAALPTYCAGGGVIHCDLRLDNVLIDRAGVAWICDWNWPCLGPAWFDTAALLVTAYASALDGDALFAAHPTAQDAPPDGLDAALAALCGYWLTRAAVPTDASPHLPSHARWSGETALAWLCARRGWG